MGEDRPAWFYVNVRRFVSAEEKWREYNWKRTSVLAPTVTMSEEGQS